MKEPLDFAREVWKELDLSKSQRAGMTYIVDGQIVKTHGAATNTDDLKEMGEIFTQVARSKKSGERKSTKSTPTNSQTLIEVM